MDVAHLSPVLIPVKAFSQAKARLASVLNPHERSALARKLATHVVQVCKASPTWIVCDDHEVAEWAETLGVNLSWQPGLGLNGAIQQATRERFARDAQRVTVIHADLPYAHPLAAIVPTDPGMMIVPDRHRVGTNVLSIDTPEFRFAYGDDSFARHLAEARRLGMHTQVVEDARLAWDVDEPEDIPASIG